ncbi:MAG: fumarylacetoacetase [Novosphingobium sp.]
MTIIDFTHDAHLSSWVPGADGHHAFPVQNLPLGVFTPPGGARARGGVAIGDYILDLAAAAPLLPAEAQGPASLTNAPTLNALFARGHGAMTALRRALSALLTNFERVGDTTRLLHPMADCTLHLPFAIGDYTDFYTGIHHAVNVGSLLRPDNPLMENYKHIPIGYHGRVSSIQPSGVDVVRPHGQVVPAGQDVPVYLPTARLDHEVEMAIWVGQANPLGTAVPIAAAADYIGGLSLLNDWSARDVQTWEYRPLGPFLGKNFHSTISPWVVTTAALAPFRTAQPCRPAGDPELLPYLHNEGDLAAGAFAVTIESWLRTERMARAGMEPVRLSSASMTNMYWTPAQLIAHHTCNGCNLAPGDLLGTGTLSGTDRDSLGSLMELSRGGREKLVLPGGEARTFLEDGDELILTAYAEREGFARIGFGECRARILPAQGT